jgi:hypothetical protein
MPPRHHGRVNEAEKRYAAYLDLHGYTWMAEPDYQKELGLLAPVVTRPDFLAERDGVRVACEVKHFETTRIRDELTLSGGYMSRRPEMAYKPLRWAMLEKADQLRPLSEAGIPLVIVLANPLGADVMLDAHHITAAMFGNGAFRIPIDLATGGAVEGAQGEWVLEEYGVFRSLKRGDRQQRENRHPHVSAIVVVHERRHASDWRDQVLSRYRVADASMDAAIDAVLAARKEIAAEVAAGTEPQGAYQWVSVYELETGHGVPLPSNWFDGPLDQRYGFYAPDRYGLLSGQPPSG